MASTAIVSMDSVQAMLLFSDFDHFAALVFSAVRANAVRQLGLMAVGALRHAGCGAANRACGAPRCGAWNVVVLDSA